MVEKLLYGIIRLGNMINFYVGDSRVAGKGIFASRDIPKGEHILRFEGKVITLEGVLSKEEDVWGNAVQIGNETYIDVEAPFVFVNHSCDPNSGLKDAATLVSVRDIAKDEEIAFDYSTCMDEDMWTMECRCGSTGCRGKIRDFKYVPVDVRTRYIRMEVVPEWLLKNQPS